MLATICSRARLVPPNSRSSLFCARKSLLMTAKFTDDPHGGERHRP
jgi:hypothetical protein